MKSIVACCAQFSSFFYQGKRGASGYDGAVARCERYLASNGCPPPSLPGDRFSHVTFMTAGERKEIATCGGEDGNSLSSCLVLDTSTGQWEENRMEPLLQERYLHAAVTLEGQVYVIGGQAGSSSTGSTTEVLPAGSKTWEQGPEFPRYMSSPGSPKFQVRMATPCAVAISTTSFLVICEKEIREFDASTAGPTSNQGWAEEAKWPKLETNREFWPGCAKVGDDKVVIAGGVGRDSTLQTTEILDLSTRRISQGGKMATPRYRFHIISFNNNGVFTTLAVGGIDGFNRLNTVEEWEPESESWSTVETRLKEKKSQFGLVAVNKNLVCPSQ